MTEQSIDTWRRRLEFLRGEEAKASDSAQKFTLQEQFEEVKQKIAEFEEESAPPNVGASILTSDSDY